MKSGRPQRVASAIRQELALMILGETKDPRLDGVVITDARVSADLRIAWVEYQLRDDSDEGRSRAAAGLEHASVFLRRALTRRLALRIVPELRFEYDDRQRAVERIGTLLGEVASSVDPDPGEEDDE